MDDTRKPHLTLVTPSRELDQEFVPLPAYTWDERPENLPLDHDECATAIYLARGHAPSAADLLKVPLHRLARMLRRSPRLQRIQEEADQLNVMRARGEFIRALDSPDDRRREWGATKIMQSRAAQGDPFAPAPAGSATTNVNVGSAREIVFTWRTAPATPAVIEHDSDSDE